MKNMAIPGLVFLSLSNGNQVINNSLVCEVANLRCVLYSATHRLSINQKLLFILLFFFVSLLPLRHRPTHRNRKLLNNLKAIYVKRRRKRKWFAVNSNPFEMARNVKMCHARHSKREKKASKPIKRQSNEANIIILSVRVLGLRQPRQCHLLLLLLLNPFNSISSFSHSAIASFRSV